MWRFTKKATIRIFPAFFALQKKLGKKQTAQAEK
jgi:hypothetical protein